MRNSQGITKSLGPGLLMAGTPIAVSHLVQSAKAGAEYGFALVGFVLLANLFKYIFFSLTQDIQLLLATTISF